MHPNSSASFNFRSGVGQPKLFVSHYHDRHAFHLSKQPNNGQEVVCLKPTKNLHPKIYNITLPHPCQAPSDA